MNLNRASLVAASLVAALTAAALADWPTLHNDYQRSGYTDEQIRGPFERKWFRDFHDEMIPTRAEAIVAEGKCFVVTFAGKLHALDVTDGATAWTFEADGPIGHSPCYRDGLLYVGSDDGFVYAVRASDGGEVWRYRTPAGVWVSPACDGEKVYFGDRSGVFHAVDAKTGAKLWTYETGYMILKPASISSDGSRIVFGSEDMRVYCLSPVGKLIWKSHKLGGLSLRDAAPTIWQDKVIVCTNPADGFHDSMNAVAAVQKKAHRDLPMLEEDKVYQDKWGKLFMRKTERRVKAENAALREYLKANRHHQAFHMLRLSDGKEAAVVPVAFTVGLHNPPTPPTFNPNTGAMYTFTGTCMNNFNGGVPDLPVAPTIIKPNGDTDPIAHANGDRLSGYGNFPVIADETSALSLMGDLLISTHQGGVAALEVGSWKWGPKFYMQRDSYGGIIGPDRFRRGRWNAEGRQAVRDAREQGLLVDTVNEWHGPDRAVVAISDQRMFWISGSQVVCLGGPDTRKTETGGKTYPEPPLRRKTPGLVAGGNLTGAGTRGPADVEKVEVTLQQVEAVIGNVASAEPTTELRELAETRDRLETHVLELIEGGPWQPLVVELGISGTETHFWRTAQAMQIVAQALPHLSDPARRKAIAYLDQLYRSGVPMNRAMVDGKGERREHFTAGPNMKPNLPETYEATAEDVYALWAYAHFANRWDTVASRAGAISAAMNRSFANGVQFDPDDMKNDACEHLNRQIAGLIGAVRIMDKAERSADSAKYRELLREALAERLHHERADRRFVRDTPGGIHHKKIPRYVGLVPELSAFLAADRDRTFQKNLTDLMTDMPVWYQAWSERMLGGENYCTPPHVSRGLYLAAADSGEFERSQLQHWLDQPWCKADLYYIEKLAAYCRSAAAEQ